MYAQYNVLSRYFSESSGMYEATGNNTSGALWINVKTLPVEYRKQDLFSEIFLFSFKVNA